MAIVTAIKEKTQSRIAMKKVMDYVAQDYKTLFQNENGEQCRLLSGQNCCGETAFQEFMATKKQYRKESMEGMGYGVKWIPRHKYITYTAPTGQRCRDNKLHDEKYLKERMEQHMAVRLQVPAKAKRGWRIT